VNGHIVTAGGVPTVTVLSAAGTDSQGVSDAACSLQGNDTSGQLGVTAGTHTAAGPVCAVVYSKPFGDAPHPVVSPTTQESASVGAYVTSTPSVMTLYFSQAPKPADAYTYNYWNAQ
ncbi:MAG: hypothetical protein ACREBW_02100, partial [Candidatus Micrarchaeaceae archaeon]